MFQIGEDRIDLVKNLYVANVRNRLRELETPDTDLQKRWIWELIQNAKDCSKEAETFIKNPEMLPYHRERQSVDIKIIYDKSQKLVEFKHNGFPFMARTLDSLMYRNSTKQGEEDNTGRFGTGFMTSHTLSRVVQIHAPFLSFKQNKWEISYIEATVYRQGSSDKQLRNEFVEMENSKKSANFDPENEEHKWTKFTYKLTNELGFQSAELGIDSFRESIMEVLLFCEEIHSIQLNDEEPIFSSAVKSDNNLTQSLIEQNIFNNIEIIEKTVMYKTNRKFFVASVEDLNEEFSKKYSKDLDKDYTERKLKFKIAFEIDSNQRMVNLEPNKVCLFCTFPLIGSENYQLPFLLNSPHFETLTERNGLILDGKEYNEEDNILTNAGLNVLILNSSIKLFKIVLNWLIQNNFCNFACFSNGLTFDEKILNTMKPFLTEIRSILEDSEIIRNSSNQLMKLKEIIILDLRDVKNPESFHNLASQLYTNVASFEDCNQWQGRTWKEISLLNVDTFVNHISCIGRKKIFKKSSDSMNLNFQISDELFANGLESLENQDFAFLNDLYSFLMMEENSKIKESSIFYKTKIILNSDNKFTVLRNLKSNIECSEDFNTIMKLCPSWQSKVIHPQIATFQSFIPKVSVNDAIQEINSILDNDEVTIQFLLSFVRYVLNNNEHRMKMYQVAKLFYKDEVPSIIELNDVDEKIWSSIDSLLIKKINKIINKDKGKKFTESLEILNYYYEIYQRFNSNNNFLVPNFNLVLTERKNLGSISNEIDPLLLKTLGPFINLKSYSHPLITSISFQKVYKLSNLIDTINSDDFYTQNGVFMDERLFSVLSIMPPEENQRLFNFQMNIRELAQLFFCSDIKPIPTMIVNELFWKHANEIVLDAIEDNLKQHSNIRNLEEMLVKDEETIFSNLNMYYEILSTENSDRQKKAMVPNYKGSFLPANNVCISKGVSEELFDLYNVIQTESDVREKYAHPNVKCNFLNVIDFKAFISSICEGLSDEQLVNDYKILQAISNLNINKLQGNNNNNNSDEQSNENEILLLKLYIANIKNRLNEIQNPTDNDKMRWPWELIQNAKDSLISPSNVKKQKQVQIYIGITSDSNTNEYSEVKFSHNGPPFTDNSFIGLLYKISQEKENPETTGRFGTGFISTHVLSKIVDINGNRIGKDGKLYGFSATMYREGIKDADIIRDFKEMQKSQNTFSKPFPLTKFIYKINSDESRECVQLGLNHLKEHISTTLINCPEIKFIELNENGIKTKYFVHEQPTKKKMNGNPFFIYEIFKDSDVYQRFVVLKNDEDKMNISVQIDDDGMIIPIKDNIENISVAFPLVGSNSHILPFYLNSHKFEPSTERNALILNGKEKINGNLTNTGINRSLLLKSIEMFELLIQILNSNKCRNVYELSRGLLLSKAPYSTFDMNWYQTKYLKDMREILASNTFVKTQLKNKSVLLKDAFFPSREIDDEILPQFIELASRYCKGIVCVDDALIWKNRVWDNLNIVELEGLICEVEVDPFLFDDPELTFLNDLLGFIWNIDRNILYDYCLIPDMNNKLHCLSKEKEDFDLKESKTVKGQIIDIMESIEINWKSTHMNHKINSISLTEDRMIHAESRIVEKIKEDNSMCFELMKFVLENNEFRENMFYFVTTLELRDYSPIIVNDINPEIWDFADKYVLEQIVLTIAEFSSEKVESLIEFFCKFIQVYKNYQKDESVFLKAKIIPNAHCNLKKLSELKNKNESFHDHLNPIMKKFFEKDLDDEIIHPKINTIIKAKNGESLYEILLIINTQMKKLDQKEDQLEVAESVICMIPQANQPLNTSGVHKLKMHDQQKIFTLYHDLINHELNEVPINSASYFEASWDKSNKIVIEFMCNKIQETETLDKFKETFLLQEDEDCFNILNSLYDHSKAFIDQYKIIPNKHGEFKLKKDLKENPGIEDDLLECIFYLNPNSASKYEFADSRVKSLNLSKINILDFYKELNEMFSEALKKPEVDRKVVEMLKKINHIDESFIDVITSTNQTEDQKARIRILQNAHIQFLQNRLRELKSPSLKDYRRWPFELIQNANDSLFASQKVPEDNNNQEDQEEEDQNNNNNYDDDDDDSSSGGDNDDNDKKLKRKVRIEFDFSDDKVTFSHNGLPFTNDSLFALLYQCSEGKVNDSRSTGKFGTGFLSTHILSREINFTGDVLTSSGATGFQVTLFRKGETDDELKKGVTEMEKSLSKNLPRKNMTKFEYILPEKDPDSTNANPHSKKAYDEGLRSLKSNVGPVLIFNPTIESITIKTQKETLVYSANHEEGNIQTIKIVTSTNQRMVNSSDKFILFNSCPKYNESEDVNINCLLQINHINEVVKRYQDFLFISYPLFDSEQHFASPVLINSPKFEPEKERSTIIMKGEDAPEGSNESSINEFILINSVDLFRQIIDFALKMNCSNLFNLSCSLRFDAIKNKFLQENFIVKLREVILSFPIFETSSGLRTVDEVLLPCIPNYEIFLDYDPKDKKIHEINKKHHSDFYNLVSQLSIESKSVVVYDCCLEWLKNVWASFPSKITIDNFIKIISNHQNVSDLNLIYNEDSRNANGNNQNTENDDNKNHSNDDDDDNGQSKKKRKKEDSDDDDEDSDYDDNYEDKVEEEDDDKNENKKDKKTKNDLVSIEVDPKVKFIKNVIVFIEQIKDCDKIFKENKILINAKGQFISSEEVHNFNLPQIFIDMLDQVRYSYEEETLHSEIRSLYENKNIKFEKFDLKDAISNVRENIDSQNAVSFMKYTYSSSQIRTSMFEYTKFFLDKSIEKVEIPDEYIKVPAIKSELDSMFSEADKYVFAKLLDKVETFDIQQNPEFFAKFFNFVKSSVSAKQFSSLKIFPNQRYTLCNSEDLLNDEIGDENVKDVLESVLQIDLKSGFILDGFSVSLRQQNKSNLSDIIRKSLSFSTLLHADKAQRFSFYSIIFQYSKKKEEAVDEIMNILNFFLGFEKVEIDDDTDDNWSSELTDDVIKLAAIEVSVFVSQFSTVMELQSNINSEDSEDNEFVNQIYEKLSSLYDFTTEGKIFPNLNRQLVPFDEIYWLHDLQLDDALMDQLLDFLIEFSYSEEIKQKVLNDSITVHESLQKKINVYDMKFLADQIMSLISDENDKENDEFRQLMLRFFKFIKSANELKITFSDLIKGEMDNRIDDFLSFLTNSEEDRKSGFTGEALVYEFLMNSGRFSVVNWLAKSDVETSFDVTLDSGNTYYIKDNGDHYDIYAEDLDGVRYFIEVKSTKAGDEEKKLTFNLSREQFGFASKMSDPNSHFVIALVKNVFKSPEILFFSKQSEPFFE